MATLNIKNLPDRLYKRFRHVRTGNIDLLPKKLFIF